MHIGTIVTVGIEDSSFIETLNVRGYTVQHVRELHEVLDISIPFDCLLVHDTCMPSQTVSALEQLYFVNNSTPTALVVSQKKIPDDMAPIGKDSSIDIFYEFEIASGSIYHRIDRMIINARLNTSLLAMQKDFNSQESLKQELSLREQILNNEREINANILKTITAGVIIFDMPGTVILANEPARQVVTNGPKDIIGAAYTEVLPAQLVDIISRIIKEITAPEGTPYAYKCRIHEVFYEIYCYRMVNYQNMPNGILMLLNDITEQENQNMLLYRSEKLATVGTMLSGIAHELRNPLAIISARVQRAIGKTTYDGDWLAKTFDSILAQTTRCASIVNSLLNFTRNTATSSGFHKIAELLDETLTYVEYQNVFDNIQITKEYGEDLMVFGDRSRFVQIFLNLITNAADAMAGKGTLTIRTVRRKSSTVLVEITDSGPGISDEIKNRIFDPFFTTKDPGKGTGLGLAIVYKIVQESNGKIWVKSEPGKTSFYVILPSEKERSHDLPHISR